MANALILKSPGVSTSKERLLFPRAAEPEKQEEVCVTDNWKNCPAYIKTSQAEKTNSGFNYEPEIKSHRVEAPNCGLWLAIYLLLTWATQHCNF